MGAHSRPKGVHRGASAPLFEVNLDLRKASATAGVFAAAAGAAVAFAPSAGAATPDDFYRLRVCESGNNYATNTGNGYYGAYQFSPSTWSGAVARAGFPEWSSRLPSSAPPSVQDAAASQLQAERGWQPWPACSRMLGLTNGTVSGASAGSAVVVRSSTPVQYTGPVSPETPPAFGGVTFTASMVGQYDADVATWQSRMRARGWPILVDGYFGPQSAGVAHAFAAEKGIDSGLPGAVDQAMWNAAWTLPVT